MPNEIKYVLLMLVVGLGAAFMESFVDYFCDKRIFWIGFTFLMGFAAMRIPLEEHPFVKIAFILITGFLCFMSSWGYELLIKPKRSEVLVDSETQKSHRDYDKEITDILEQAEKELKELPLVTLWWGLDGVQLNRDGSFEWISKRPKKPSYDWLRPAPIPGYPIGGYLQMPGPWNPLQMSWGTYGSYPTIHGCIYYEPGMSIASMTAQLNAAQLAMSQSYQNQALLSCINAENTRYRQDLATVDEKERENVMFRDIYGNILPERLQPHSQEKQSI